MAFEKLNAPTLRDLFVKELESMILSGKLEVGERLPPERDIAERMQVSRAVVNSGINDLARKGFLHVKPRSGVYVADYRRYGTSETLLSIMQYNGGHLNRSEVRSILEIKLVVDRLAAELAIQRLNEGNLLALRERMEAMEQENTTEGSANATFEFYHELAMISGNTLLPLIYRSFRIPVVHLWARFIQRYGKETTCMSAYAIYQAVQAKDEPAAVLAVKNAVSSSIQGSREIYDD
ncbi:GntR family transcriptional regulator [Christensenellaceae bacterium OttesenSCG-928-L17]|nr:GntR family transcriptional regulator [Christensenellaceae bacterium OttesenSCG-928-L17]